MGNLSPSSGGFVTYNGSPGQSGIQDEAWGTIGGRANLPSSGLSPSPYSSTAALMGPPRHQHHFYGWY